MSAAERFKQANAKFSERGEYLPPNQREEKQADGSTKLVYDSPANYTLKVRRCVWKTARPPKRDEFYIVEAEVTKSSNPRVAVGSIRTWMQGMTNEAGPTAVTAFLVAALGYDRRDASDKAAIEGLDKGGKLPALLAQTLEDPTDSSCVNALKDFEVNVEVKEIITKGNQKPFNLHTFFPADDMKGLRTFRKAIEAGESIQAALEKESEEHAA